MFYLFLIVLFVCNVLQCNELAIKQSNGTELTLDLNKKETHFNKPFKELIEASEEKNHAYLLGVVTTPANKNLFCDGAHLISLLKKNRKKKKIEFYVLTKYEQTPCFRPLFSYPDKGPQFTVFKKYLKLWRPDKFYNTASMVDYMLENGITLIDNGKPEIGLDLVARAYPLGSFWQKWEAYKGLGKIIFPDESNVSREQRQYIEVPDWYKKAFLGWYFLFDVL